MKLPWPFRRRVVPNGPKQPRPLTTAQILENVRDANACVAELIERTKETGDGGT